MHYFDFLVNGLGIASPPHFANDFLKKIDSHVISINWPNFIA